MNANLHVLHCTVFYMVIYNIVVVATSLYPLHLFVLAATVPEVAEILSLGTSYNANETKYVTCSIFERSTTIFLHRRLLGSSYFLATYRFKVRAWSITRYDTWTTDKEVSMLRTLIFQLRLYKVRYCGRMEEMKTQRKDSGSTLESKDRSINATRL